MHQVTRHLPWTLVRMASRSRRDALSNIESLILAQAVWENGANAWPAVAKTLSTHSLISRPKSFFTPQASQVMYQNLMQEAGLERTEACNAVHSPINHKLAEKYYRARVQELREQILAEEEKFKTIVSDLEAIRAGNFDAEITAKITGVPVEPHPQSTSSETKDHEAPALEELFEGSDLTGVSATPASPSQSQEKISTVNTTAEELQQDPQAAEGTSQAQTLISRSQVATGAPPQDVEMAQSLPKGVEPPLSSTVLQKSTSLSTTPKGVQGAKPKDEDHMVLDPKSPKEEEEEEEEEADEYEVAGEAVANTPKQEARVLEPEEHHGAEPPSASPAEDIQEDWAHIPGEAPEQPVATPGAESGITMDDGESSGEEPLHTRRSVRQRRATIDPTQPVQTRGKARRQRPEIPEGSEAEPTEDIEELQDDITKIQADHDVSPMPSKRSQSKRKASFIEGVDSPHEKKRTRDDSEPVEEDDVGANHGRGRRPTGTRTEGHKRFQAVIGMLHSQISQHRNGNIFHNPIKNSEAPDYHEIVKRPMDLKTIKNRVKDGSIANSQEYQRDIMLMFANAMMYNRPGSDVHTMAEDMMVESEDHIKAFRQTEGLVNVRGGRHS